MKITIVITAVWCLTATAIAVAGDMSDILMDDGSVIHGEVVSLNDGKFTVRTSSMGEFSLEASRVRRITRVEENAPPEAQAEPSGRPAVSNQAVENAKNMIMSDPEALGSVKQLSDDPEFRELMNDPQIVAALKSGDYGALINNPKFREFMNNPKTQELANRLMRKQR